MAKRLSDIPAVLLALRHFVYLICLLHGLAAPTGATESVDQSVPDSLVLQNIPNRPQDAIRGQQFGMETKGMTGKERQKRALEELLRGNVPDFLRNLKPVRLSHRPPHGEMITAIIWVTPDYLAIGSDEDFLRIPLTYPSAVMAAQAFDCILPTRKMVDAIYDQATCHLRPDPLPPGPKMRSSEYYLKHREMIRAQRKTAGCALGELVSGHKKDVVLTNRLNDKPGRIAIYGWHRKSGETIQPLSTVHGERYADYSHGVRLIYKTVWINGEALSILEVLQDPGIARVLTYEGFLARLRRMLRIK